jgi:2-polyprenyl-6-methoxyphenol hydroxylase-like FAD-dependent oxidoreductase
MRPLNIAVAGAGPAGLAAALYLHRAGHKVTIFERFDEPKPLGSGLILQPTGLTVLHDLGLLDSIVALGARIDRLYGTDAKSGRTVLDVRYDTLKGERFGLAVHRAALFGVLYQAVQQARIAIETGVTLAGFDAANGTATLADDKGRRIGGFDLVVDASGARSVLRRHVAHSSDPKPLAYGAFWGSLTWPGMSFAENALTQRYDKASVMIGVLPIGRAEPAGERMTAFFWSLKPDEVETVKARGLPAWKERVLSYWPECAAFTDQIEDFSQLSLARYGHHTLVLPIGRRLAVIGDAAHSTSPQLGQGANMALLDARALAYALETSANIDSAVETYARVRRWHMRVFQALSWMFTPFYQSDSIMLPFIRDRLVATIGKVPPGPQILAAMVSGMLIDPFQRLDLQEAVWRNLVPSPTVEPPSPAPKAPRHTPE